MHIGLIGGIGPAATDLYYRGLISRMAAVNQPLELTMVHADAPTLVRNFESKKPLEQAKIFLSLTRRLEQAGAEAVVISSIGGHFCVGPFAEMSPLPVLNIIDALDSRISRAGMKSVGILGTDAVMKTNFYGGVKGVASVVPEPETLDRVHRAYLKMGVSGQVSAEDREFFIQTGRDLIANGAEVVLLGGTDLFLAFGGRDVGYPTLDCAEVHIDAIAKWATEAAHA